MNRILGLHLLLKCDTFLWHLMIKLFILVHCKLQCPLIIISNCFKLQPYHVGEGHSILWHNQSNIKGRLHSWLIPAREWSSCICCLKCKKNHSSKHECKNNQGIIVYILLLNPIVGMYMKVLESFLTSTNTIWLLG